MPSAAAAVKRPPALMAGDHDDRIAVVDQKPMHRLTRDHCAALLDRPGCGRMVGDIPMHDPSRDHVEHHEHIEEGKRAVIVMKKSQARTAWAWFRTNVAHRWEGRPPRDGRRSRRYRPTVRGDRERTHLPRPDLGEPVRRSVQTLPRPRGAESGARRCRRVASRCARITSWPRLLLEITTGGSGVAAGSSRLRSHGFETTRLRCVSLRMGRPGCR